MLSAYTSKALAWDLISIFVHIRPLNLRSSGDGGLIILVMPWNDSNYERYLYYYRPKNIVEIGQHFVLSITYQVSSSKARILKAALPSNSMLCLEENNILICH